MNERRAWRDQVQEVALEPELPIIDAHHHLWSIPPVPDRFESYDADALFADMRGAGHRIVGTVLVDSHSNYREDGPPHLRFAGETEHGERVAREALRQGGGVAGACCAIVSTADLLLGEAVGELLDAHMAASPRFRGIRHMTAYDDTFGPVYGADSPGIMLRPEFARGFKELEKRGLCFDAWVFHTQHNELITLAGTYPGTTIIVDHMGGPIGAGSIGGDGAARTAEWKDGLAKLAACESIFLKLGGLNQGFSGFVSHDQSRPPSSAEMAAQQGDLIRTAIDLFGPDRCLFESNFPADMIYTSYTVLWNAFKRMTSDMSSDERAAMFMNTAMRAYRITSELGA